jgi:hypothetical protein
MRESGIRGLLVYAPTTDAATRLAISADHWPDDLRLSDIEPQFVC